MTLIAETAFGWVLLVGVLGFVAGALIGAPAWTWLKGKLPWGKS